MDKKVYIQPNTEICITLPMSTMLMNGSVTGTSEDAEIEIGWGGGYDDSKDPDVKGESWTDIWE